MPRPNSIGSKFQNLKNRLWVWGTLDRSVIWNRDNTKERRIISISANWYQSNNFQLKLIHYISYN